MKHVQYIAWQSALTAHQYFTHIASAKHLELSCKFVSKYPYPLGRVSKEWSQSFANNIIMSDLSSFEKLRLIKKLISNKDNLHVVSSPFENLWQITIILILILTKSKYVIIMEPYNDTKHDYFKDKKLRGSFKKFLRPLIYKYIYFYFLIKAIRIYAISPKCVTQLTDLGVERNKISNFGYFIEAQSQIDSKSQLKDSISFVYLGSEQSRKGLDHLLNTWQRVAAENKRVSLDIYGASLQKSKGNIRFSGMIPFGRAPEYLSRYDVVIIPSKFDGWSLVANEAIFANTFILAHQAVGASVIVKNCSVGLVFNDQNELEGLLSDTNLLANHIRNTPAKNFSVAQSLLTPEKAGAYFAHELTKNGKSCDLGEILSDDNI